jgi:hypothetical protein
MDSVLPQVNKQRFLKGKQRKEVTGRDSLRIAEVQAKKHNDNEILAEAKNEEHESRILGTNAKIWRDSRKSEFELAKTTVKLNLEKRAKLA